MSNEPSTLRKQIAESLYETNLQKVIADIGHSHTTMDSELETLGFAYFGKLWLGIKTPGWVRNFSSMKTGQCLIINTTLKGEHWIGVYKGATRILFYDSFGRKPNALFPRVGKIIKSTEQDPEQDVRETNCGQRSLAFLLVCRDFGEEIGYYV